MANRRVPVIDRIHLQHIRGFTDLQLELNPGITVVIGKNGTNKTSLLRAVAVALAGPEGQALLSLPTGGLITTGAKSGAIEVSLDDGTELRSTLSRRGSGEYVDPMTAQGDDGHIFACAYGAGRGIVGTDAGREYRVLDAVLSLFDYRRELVDPELTLRRVRDRLGTDLYASRMEAVKGVLGLGPDDDIVLPQGGGVAISGPDFGGAIPLAGWADGYRLTFTWLLDLFGWALRADRLDKDGQLAGIVLIDEIDQHLHPALQAAVVPELGELLPNAQIIMTTHSPLVALGAQPEQLVVLHSRGGRVEVDPNVPDYRAWSAEDMLTDDRLFDSSVYSPEMVKQLHTYEQLVQKPPADRTKDEERELAELAKVVRGDTLPPEVARRLADANAEFERRMSEA
jgi:hypothetical protein